MDLFIYGTLKRGLPKNALLRSQQFLREARTLPLYRLLNGGPFPCLVGASGSGVAVEGELWRVDDNALRLLDAYEGAPVLFRRQEVAIEGCSSPVFAYLYNGDAAALEDCGRRWPPVKEPP